MDDILGENIEEFPNSDAITSFGAFKRTTFPADDIQSSKTCSGKRISRKSFEEESENESDGSERFVRISLKFNDIYLIF